MLAIISDLHLQHVEDDVLYYRDGQQLMAAGVRRNVSASALQRFLHVAYTTARKHEAKTLEIVFAGDIFELHRSPLWLHKAAGIRPTQDLGREDATPENQPVLGIANLILDRIEAENQEFFKALRRFVLERTVRFDDRTRKLDDKKVKKIIVSYLPGNHDRLANAWRVMRRRIRKLLCIRPAGDGPFPNTLERLMDDDGRYGVRVRHGQEYDSTNFAIR